MVDPVRAEIIDVADPQNRGRVRLQAPAMGEGWQPWAPVLSPGAALPPTYRPGDVVLVAFEGGDPGLPVVLGALAAAAGSQEEGADSGGTLPTPLQPTELTLNDLVVDGETRAALEEVIAWVRHDPVLRRDWGFGQRLGPGYRVLFVGSAGTGKTMAAQVIAGHLGRSVLQLDLARIVSKYIGETEKAIDAVFTAAEVSGAILLLDEVDALFGRRTDVKDSHDRYANLEVAHLLHRLEEYRGLAIVTTNLLRNLDPAFVRRLDKVIPFPIPDEDGRLQLWRRLLAGVPEDRIGAIDLAAISHDHELSGGAIVNVLRDASLRALDLGTKIGEAEIRNAIGRLRSG